MIKSFVNFIKGLWKDKRVIYDLAKNDFKSKYTNSLLGIVWAFLLPLIIILVLWFVFEVGYRSSPVSDVPFILWYIPAFLSWNFFTDALATGSGCIFDYYYLVKNMQFTVSSLPVIKIISSSFVHVFFVVFIVIINLLYGNLPKLSYLQVLYYYFCMIVLLLGATWLMSSLAVFAKDVLNVVSLISQVGFWATPLVWDPTQMPLVVQRIAQINPMYYVCMGYRDSFISGTWFWEHPGLTLYFWAFAGILLIVGAYVFRKMRPQFADML